jgi:hypothetical protein
MQRWTMGFYSLSNISSTEIKELIRFSIFYLFVSQVVKFDKNMP